MYTRIVPNLVYIILYYAKTVCMYNNNHGLLMYYLYNIIATV